MSRTPEAVNRTHAPVSTLTLALLGACFGLSGVAALVYQTAWTRQFAIVFGTSELAVAAVLAAYMGGLALGALIAERLLVRIRRPLLNYALLELAIAASAVLAVPFLLWLADVALQALFGGQAELPSADHASTALFHLISAFIALALPTTFMGATLPLLARHAVTDEAQIGRRIGLLYAMNTAGAVVGALLTAFVLLPELGLTGTIWIGAVINGVVFLLAAALAQRVPHKPRAKGYALDTPSAPTKVYVRPESLRRFPGPAWVLPLMLLAGAVAFF
jgi:spermidine synthase